MVQPLIVDQPLVGVAQDVGLKHLAVMPGQILEEEEEEDHITTPIIKVVMVAQVS